MQIHEVGDVEVDNNYLNLLESQVMQPEDPEVEQVEHV
jgi:hypothetical protein